MSADGFMLGDFDAWKCAEPAPERPDPPDVHDECERRIGELEAEIESLGAELAARDARIEELEVENAALIAENDSLKGTYQ